MLVRFIMLSLLTVGASRADAQQAASSPSPMKCETGPVTRTFGGTKWMVYSCDDQASMVVVSAPGNPAFPFYFAVRPEAGTYKISGEGTGNKTASDAAGDELSKLVRTDFAALLAATRAASASR